MRTLLACTVVGLLALIVSATDHPVARDRLVVKDNAANADRRTLKFKAARDAGIDPSVAADPTGVGATLEVVGRGPGDGTSGVVVLEVGKWIGLGAPPGVKGYKWIDQDGEQGIRKVTFKPGSNGGSLVVSGRKSDLDYLIPQPQVGPIDVRFTIGADVWCAHFDAVTFQENVVGRVKAKDAPAPADCALPPPSNCGNGTLEGSEECDDGGAAGGDGCSSACELENTSALCEGVSPVSGTALDSVVFASGLSRPVYVTAPRLDPSRVFIVEQIGRVKVVKNGVLLPAAFLDIQSKTSSPCFSEQGLLSMAFDPGYETNGRFYVNYTDTSGDTVIARYTVTGDPKTSDDADESSEVILRTIDQDFANHNGGQLQFGSDGLLYVGMGDGGSGCDPFGRAQDDAQRLGKMLRIDVNAPAPANLLDEIWAKGLRNPWRFSFDRATGDLYIGDVGQFKIEEVDVVAAPVPSGLNYGWEYFEGLACVDPVDCPGTLCPGSTVPFTMPVLTYGHNQGCSVTGGYVYRGCAMPDLRGTYFYSDYCGAFIKSFVYSGGMATSQQDRTADVDPAGADTITGVTSFGEDARGEIYVAEHGACASATGTVYKLVPGS